MKKLRFLCWARDFTGRVLYFWWSNNAYDKLEVDWSSWCALEKRREINYKFILFLVLIEYLIFIPIIE